MAYLETDSPVNVGSGTNGWGDSSGSWWVVIILFALIFGWGGNGFGYGNRGGSSGAADNYVLASDFANIQRQLSDGFSGLADQSRYIQNGLCDGFYAMNTSLLNGFNGTNTAIMQNGYETRNAIQGVSSQLADCCCKTQTAIQGVNYNLATQGCAIQNTIQSTTRDIIDNQNANFRAIHDELVAQRIEDKNTRIAELESKVGALNLAASQAAQNNYIINSLRPSPIPAYTVPNTYYCNYGCNGSTIQ